MSCENKNGSVKVVGKKFGVSCHINLDKHVIGNFRSHNRDSANRFHLAGQEGSQLRKSGACSLFPEVQSELGGAVSDNSEIRSVLRQLDVEEVIESEFGVQANRVWPVISD